MKRRTVSNIYAEIRSLLTIMKGAKTVDFITKVIDNITKKGLANQYLTRQRVSGCISACCCKYGIATCINSRLY